MKFRVAMLLLAAACGGHARPGDTLPAIPLTVESLTADSIAHAMVLRAFAADAKFATPDSTYLPETEVIADGAPRADAPRIAGVAADGSIQLGSSRFAVTGNLVWGSIQYRWVPATSAQQMVDGWATIVIAHRRTGEWRIMHLHSSTVRPVEADSAH